MKTKSLYILLITLLFTTIYGCTKNDNPPAANLSFKVDGVAKSTNTISSTTTTSPTQLELTASFNTGELLYLTIVNPKIGSFDVSTGAATVSYVADTLTTHTYKGATGTVILTSYSGNSAKGTFEFTGRNVAQSSVAITDGTFQTN